MKKKMVYLSVALFLVWSGMSVYAVERVDVKALFEAKCSICHSIDRPKQKHKTGDEWTETVMRMKNVNGCLITDHEARLLIDYLTKNYGGLS